MLPDVGTMYDLDVGEEVVDPPVVTSSQTANLLKAVKVALNKFALAIAPYSEVVVPLRIQRGKILAHAHYAATEYRLLAESQSLSAITVAPGAAASSSLAAMGASPDCPAVSPRRIGTPFAYTKA